MKISGISSEQSQARSPSAHPRSSFSLLGPSVHLDPRTHAVRGDLADVRLADSVFAPHYAAPLMMTIRQACQLRAAASVASETLADLNAGSGFEALDFSGISAWGIARPSGLVGYVDKDVLDIIAEPE